MPPANSPARIFLRAVSRSIGRSSIRSGGGTVVGGGPDTPPPKTVAQLGVVLGATVVSGAFVGGVSGPPEEPQRPSQGSSRKKAAHPTPEAFCSSACTSDLCPAASGAAAGGRGPPPPKVQRPQRRPSPRPAARRSLGRGCRPPSTA